MIKGAVILENNDSESLNHECKDIWKNQYQSYKFTSES